MHEVFIPALVHCIALAQSTGLVLPHVESVRACVCACVCVLARVCVSISNVRRTSSPPVVPGQKMAELAICQGRVQIPVGHIFGHHVDKVL